MNKETTLTRNSAQPSEALNQPSDEVPALAPPVDIYESKDEFVVVADLPGVTPEDVSVRLSGDRLEVEGRQTLPPGVAALMTPVRFVRTFVVPDSIDAAGVKATSEQGILTVVLKKTEARKPRQITVNAS